MPSVQLTVARYECSCVVSCCERSLRVAGASRLVWSHSYYDTAAWEKMLQDNLGDCMLTHCNRKKNPKVGRLDPPLPIMEF